MRRISTNAGPLANRPGLGDTAGRRDGTHMLGLAQAPLGTGQAASGEVLSFQRSLVAGSRQSTGTADERARMSGVVVTPRRQLSVSVRGMKGTWNINPESKCRKPHSEAGPFVDISKG